MGLVDENCRDMQPGGRSNFLTTEMDSKEDIRDGRGRLAQSPTLVLYTDIIEVLLMLRVIFSLHTYGRYLQIPRKD